MARWTKEARACATAKKIPGVNFGRNSAGAHNIAHDGFVRVVTNRYLANYLKLERIELGQIVTLQDFAISFRLVTGQTYKPTRMSPVRIFSPT